MPAQIHELVPFLQVPIRVLYLDRSVDSGDPTAVNHHDFVPEALSGGSRTTAELSTSLHQTLLWATGDNTETAAPECSTRQSTFREGTSSSSSSVLCSTTSCSLVCAAAVADGSKPASAVEPHVQLLYRPGELLIRRSSHARHPACEALA
jgi:Peptidase C65 Otubain